MRLKRYLFPAAALAAFACAIILVPEALAQFGLEAAQKGTGIPKTPQITTVIARILSTALGLVGTLFLLLMVYAGFLWMTARGDSKKVDTAKQLIAGAVIGVMIIAGAYAITDFVLKAATGQGGESGAGSSSVEPFSVAIGGDCSQSRDCAGTAVCTNGKCVAANFGSCVPGKQCASDAECSSNGGCFDGVCSCDAI